ncbi:hypothetical protein EU527_07500 [Candidatus Thorarchaeota archaeon]|nr:MAG: hypothetical protein EU527_07500 [Candidatus Thorarchaeota archaeon]
MAYRHLGSIEVQVVLGKFDDSELDLVVKAHDIPLGLSPSGIIGAGGTVGGFGITIKEASNAKVVLQWPGVSIEDPDRRDVIYQTTRNALKSAEEMEAPSVGLFTMGLEVSRIPSWEIAEEIVQAINDHSKEETAINKVIIIVSSPIQMSSFQFALNNLILIRQR